MNSYYGFLRKKVVSASVGTSSTERAAAAKLAKVSSWAAAPKFPDSKAVVTAGPTNPLYLTDEATTRQFVRLLKIVSGTRLEALTGDVLEPGDVLAPADHTRYLDELSVPSRFNTKVRVEDATPEGYVQAFFGFLAANKGDLVAGDMSRLEVVECVTSAGIAQINMPALKALKVVFAGLGEKLDKTRAVFKSLYMSYHKSGQSAVVLKDLQTRLARTLFGTDNPKVQAALGLAIRYFDSLVVAPVVDTGAYAGPPLFTEYSDFSGFSVAEKFQSLGLLLNAAKLPALAATTLATVDQVTDLTATLGEYAKGDALDCLGLPSLRAYSQEALVDAIAELLISLGVEKAFDAGKDGNVDTANLFAPFSRRGTRFLPSNVFVVLQRSGLTPPILNAIADALVAKAEGFTDVAATGAFLGQAMRLSGANIDGYPFPEAFVLESLVVEAALVAAPVLDAGFDLDAAIPVELGDGSTVTSEQYKLNLLSLPEATYATRLAELKAGYSVHLLIAPTQGLTASLTELDSEQLGLLAAWVIGAPGITAAAIPDADDGTAFADADVAVKRTLISSVVEGDMAGIGLVTAQAVQMKVDADALTAKGISLTARLGELAADELNALADEIATADADGGLGIAKDAGFDALATDAKIDALAAVLLTEAQLDATEVIVERMVLGKVFLALPPAKLAEFRVDLNRDNATNGFTALAELAVDDAMAAHSATVLASFATVAPADQAATYKSAQELVLTLLSASVRADLGTLSDAQVSALGLGLNTAVLEGYGNIGSFEAVSDKTARIEEEIGKMGLVTQKVAVYKYEAEQVVAVKKAEASLQAVLAVSSKDELVALWVTLGITDAIETVFPDLDAATGTVVAAAIFERRPVGLPALTAFLATAKDSYFNGVFTPFLQLFNKPDLDRLIALPAITGIPGLALEAVADDSVEAAATVLVDGAKALSGAQMQEAVSVILAQANKIYLESMFNVYTEADFTELTRVLVPAVVTEVRPIGNPDITAVEDAKLAVFVALDGVGDSNALRVAYATAVEKAEPIYQRRNIAALTTLMDEETFTEPMLEAFAAYVQNAADPGPGLGIDLDVDDDNYADLGTAADKKARIVATLVENLDQAEAAFIKAEGLRDGVLAFTASIARIDTAGLGQLSDYIQNGADLGGAHAGLGVDLNEAGSTYLSLETDAAKRDRILAKLGVEGANLAAALAKADEIAQQVEVAAQAARAAQVVRILAEIGVRDDGVAANPRYVDLGGDLTLRQLERLSYYIVAGQAEGIPGRGISLDGEVADTDFAGLGFGPRKLRMATVLGAHGSLEDLTAVADKIEQIKAGVERGLVSQLCCYGVAPAAVLAIIIMLYVYRAMIQSYMSGLGLGFGDGTGQ
jgi:hypothetical protein